MFGGCPLVNPLRNARQVVLMLETSARHCLILSVAFSIPSRSEEQTHARPLHETPRLTELAISPRQSFNFFLTFMSWIAAGLWFGSHGATLPSNSYNSLSMFACQKPDIRNKKARRVNPVPFANCSLLDRTSVQTKKRMNAGKR